jgi:hypothetical protein
VVHLGDANVRFCGDDVIPWPLILVSLRRGKPVLASHGCSVGSA